MSVYDFNKRKSTHSVDLFEKAKAFQIGQVDKSGKNVKTANGWEPIKKKITTGDDGTHSLEHGGSKHWSKPGESVKDFHERIAKENYGGKGKNILPVIERPLVNTPPESKKEFAIGDKVVVQGKDDSGIIVKLPSNSSEQYSVDFGNGNVYGIMPNRIKKFKGDVNKEETEDNLSDTVKEGDVVYNIDNERDRGWDHGQPVNVYKITDDKIAIKRGSNDSNHILEYPKEQFNKLFGKNKPEIANVVDELRDIHKKANSYHLKDNDLSRTGTDHSITYDKEKNLIHVSAGSRNQHEYHDGYDTRVNIDAVKKHLDKKGIKYEEEMEEYNPGSEKGWKVLSRNYNLKLKSDKVVEIQDMMGKEKALKADELFKKYNIDDERGFGKQGKRSSVFSTERSNLHSENGKLISVLNKIPQAEALGFKVEVKQRKFHQKPERHEILSEREWSEDKGSDITVVFTKDNKSETIHTTNTYYDKKDHMTGELRNDDLKKIFANEIKSKY